MKFLLKTGKILAMNQVDLSREEYYIKQDEWEKFDGYYQSLNDGEEKDKLKETWKRISNMNPGESEYKNTGRYDYEIVRFIALEPVDWRIKINEDKEFREKFLGTNSNGEASNSEAQKKASEHEYRSASDGSWSVFIAGSYFDRKRAHIMKTSESFKTAGHAQKFIDLHTSSDNVSHFEFKFRYDKNEVAFEIYRNNSHENNLVETFVDCALYDSDRDSQVGTDLRFRLFMNLKEVLERSLMFYNDIMKKKDYAPEEIKEQIKKQFGLFDEAHKDRLGWMANQKKHKDTLISNLCGMRADFDVFKDGDNVFVDTLCNGDCQMIWFYHADIKEVIRIVSTVVEQGEKSGLGYEPIKQEIYEKSQAFREPV